MQGSGEVPEYAPRTTLAFPGLMYMAISPDGDALATVAHFSGRDANTSSELRLWSASTGEHRAMLNDHAGGWIQFLLFNHDGKLVAAPGKGPKDPFSGLYPTYLQLWDAKTGQKGPATDAMSAWGGSVQDAKFGQTRPRQPADVWLYDYRSGQIRPASVHGVFSPNPSSPFIGLWHETKTCSAKSADGKVAARTSNKGILALTAPDQPRRVLKKDAWRMFVAFAPDGKTLVTAREPATVEIWDVNTGEKRATIETDWDVVSMVPPSPKSGEAGEQIPLLLISPDGKTLASAGGQRAPIAS